MATERFKAWRPAHNTMIRVQQCADIIDEYQQQGLVLTLRQLYYQLVSRDLIPNSEKSYKNLGATVSRARLAGMLDWDAIEDRGRRPRTSQDFGSVAELVEVALSSYRLPRWKGQREYAELWVEKEALAGVLEPLATEYHTTLMVNKGYSSSSAMYASANRLIRMADDDDYRRPVTIFYLGDHDPSGEDMVRDVRERLELFTNNILDLTVEKIGLTMAQIRQYRPPPNPAKVTDSRAAAYIKKYGDKSWEVDALDPATLQRIIRAAFTGVIDKTTMDAIKEQEQSDKDKLRAAVTDIMADQ